MDLENTIKRIIRESGRTKLDMEEQRLKWDARNRDLAPQADAMAIAKAYAGRDVTREEVKELEPRVWIYCEYIDEALRKLGYNILRDDSTHPPRLRYTLKKLCPHCKKLLPPEFQK